MTLTSSAGPNDLALIDGDRSFTYRAFERCVDNVAVQLAHQGVRAGTQIAVSLINSAEIVVVFHAALRLGAIWVGIDPKTPSARRHNILQRLPNAHVIDDLGLVNQWMHIDKSFERPAIDETGPSVIAFTSGTTGSPKGVVHSLQNVTLPARVSAVVEPPTPGERIGTPLSLSTANMMILGPLSAYVRGTTAVIMNRRWSQGLADDIAAYGVTRIFVVAAMLEDLLAARTTLGSDPAVSQLKRVIVGGSGARPETLAAFGEIFGVRPTMSYGLSEAPTGIVRESFDDPIGSGRGFPLPHIAIMIRDPETSALLPTGSEGRICISAAQSGPFANEWTPLLGYLDDPERTNQAVVAGEFRTEDLGRLDRDGALAVTGRLSDVIIRGGANISPGPLADTACSLKGVTGAITLGLPDERLGERVVVFVESAIDVAQDVEAALCANDHTFDEVVIIETLPRNAMGKIERDAVESSYRS